MPATAKVSKFNHNVASFPNKLYSMLNDPTTKDLIRWTDSGTSFIVTNATELARRVLPRYFKHDRFSSFVRQLNTYGFRKVPQLQQGVLQPDDDSGTLIEFSNPRFVRDQPALLPQVQRKRVREKQLVCSPLQPKPSSLYDEIAAVKNHQLSISNELKCIQQENQAMWREILDARVRHQQHQDTIDKVLQFLASAVSSHRPNKRRLMIGEQQDIAKPSPIDPPSFDLNDLVEAPQVDQDQLQSFMHLIQASPSHLSPSDLAPSSPTKVAETVQQDTDPLDVESLVRQLGAPGDATNAGDEFWDTLWEQHEE